MPRPANVPRLARRPIALAMLLTASLPCAAQQGGSFREGACSGVLCDYIGGSQAPAAQQKSLFREGECGGVLCDTIGGSQAPKRSEPPPNCGGGLLCDVMPYRMGASLSGAAPARGGADGQAAQPAPAARPQKAEAPKPRRRKAVAAE